MKKSDKAPRTRYAAKNPAWLDALKVQHPARVLLIEDDKDIQRLLCFFLESAGIAVEALDDGESAIDYMGRESRPDLILLDRMLPDCHGEELLSRFKRDLSWKKSPVIFLSALSDTGEIKTLMASGASGYITKPFAPIEVARQINRQLTDKPTQTALCD